MESFWRSMISEKGPLKISLHSLNLLRCRRLKGIANCWLKAAIETVMRNPSLFSWVVNPSSQSYDTDYVGLFYFRIWSHGNWKAVMVDDQLPVKLGTDEYIGFKCLRNSQFWLCLLEKAYAKVLGHYEDLRYGQPNEALEDFTGGLGELFIMRLAYYNECLITFDIMKESYEANSSVVGYKMEEQKDDHLDWAHFFVTNCKTCVINEEKEPYVRVKIPNSKRLRNNFEWYELTANSREELGLTLDEEDETWVHLTEFITAFILVGVCHFQEKKYLPSSSNSNSSSRWQWLEFQDAWVPHKNAGGSLRFSSFPSNPQIRFTLVETDDPSDPNKNCTVIIALMQKCRKAPRKLKQSRFRSIGYTVYKVPTHDKRAVLDGFYYATHSPIIATNFYTKRKVCLRYQVPKGDYVVIPSTYLPQKSGEFLLRIVSIKHHGVAATTARVKHSLRIINPKYVHVALFVLILIIFAFVLKVTYKHKKSQLRKVTGEDFLLNV